MGARPGPGVNGVFDRSRYLDLAAVVDDPAMREALRLATVDAIEGLDEGVSGLNDEVQWRARPVPMREFIRSKYFLGLDERECWPAILEIAEAIERGGPDGEPFEEVVLTGAIGYGKTFLSHLLMARMIYEASCFVDPHRSLGSIASHTPIVFIQQSITKPKAQKVLFGPLSYLIRRSPYFNRHYPFDKRIKSELRFDRVHVEPVAGNEHGAIGENVVGGTVDETNFMAIVSKSVHSISINDVYDTAERNYQAIARRRKSRFMRQGRLPGWLVLVSSKQRPSDFTERKVAEARTDPRIGVIDLPQWATKQPGTYLGPTFRVVVGNRGTRTRILSDVEEPTANDGELIDDIPIEFKVDFERDPDRAVRDIAGRSTLAIHPYIVRRELIKGIFTDELQSPFTRLTTVGMKDGFGILPERLHGNMRQPRAAHLDLAKNHCAAGVTIAYVGGFARVERSAFEVSQRPDGTYESGENDDGALTYFERLPIYVLEGVLTIEAAPGDEIMAMDVVRLLVSLREHGCRLRWVTTDHFGGYAVQQLLREQGFSTGEQSVDIDPGPYAEFKTAIYDGRVRSAYHPVLARELTALEVNDKTGQVDHPKWDLDEDGERVEGSKDAADSAAGAIYLLSRQKDTWARPFERPSRAELWAQR